jgi:RNA polymerase sigma-70 factor (ECF subfamily)
MEATRPENALEDTRLEDILQRAREGDAEAFAEIYQAYYHQVQRRCRRFFRRAEDAEDAAADVFLKVRSNLGGLDPSQPFKNWLMSVTTHHCIDRLRLLRREERTFVATDVSELMPRARGDSPLGLLLRREERQQVRQNLRRLPEHYRVPVTLRYYGELSYDAIASKTGRKLNAVKTLLFRAKQELGQQMAGAAAAESNASPSMEMPAVYAACAGD